MVRRVTPEQHAKLIAARDSWPSHLSSGSHLGNAGNDNTRAPRCTLEYLASKIEGPYLGWNIRKNSEAYGIPSLTLSWWMMKNDFFYTNGQSRARGMLRRYQRFLDGITPVPETTPVHIKQEAYATR